MTEYGLGRIPEFDERSRGFAAVSRLNVTIPQTKTWRRGQAYDQGRLPQCVAYAGKGLLNTAPLSAYTPYDIRTAYSTQAIYDGAQRLDQWPGEDYDGTSGLGLGKYLVELGVIREYQWCFGVDDVLLNLSYNGPVAIGVNWYTGMFDPDGFGYITPTGQVEGGHEVELIGVDTARRRVVGMNSWGRDWGLDGRFFMRYEVLGQLLHEGGDAVVFKK